MRRAARRSLRSRLAAGKGSRGGVTHLEHFSPGHESAPSVAPNGSCDDKGRRTTLKERGRPEEISTPDPRASLYCDLFSPGERASNQGLRGASPRDTPTAPPAPAGIGLVRARRVLEHARVVLRRELVRRVHDLEATRTASDHDDDARPLAGSDEDVLRPRRPVNEVPGLQATLLTLDHELVIGLRRMRANLNTTHVSSSQLTDRFLGGVPRGRPRPGKRGEALLMRMRGLEPPRARAHTDLNRARLPIPPHPRARAV